MENLEINEELVPAKKSRKAFGTENTELTAVEAGVLSRRGELNFPALQAMFGLTETELQTILDKLPPVENCNC